MIPLLENKICSISWLLGSRFPVFLVSKTLGVLVSNFLGFKIAKFQRFNDPILKKFHFMFFIDIDLISKIIKNLLDGPFFQSFGFPQV